MAIRTVRLRRGGSGVACILAGALILAGGVLFGQSWDTSEPVIEGARSLYDAVNFIKAKYGWRITYEDLLVLYPGDIRDISAMYHRSDSRPMYAARFGRIDMREVLPSVLSARDDPAVLLQRAIDIYNSSGGVGAFRLLRTGDVFHVIPAKTRDVNGKVVEVTPLLDTPVTIPEEERTVQQTLSVITDAVSSVTPVSVVSGGLYLRNPWKKIVFGAQDEPARSALLRLLDTTGNQNNTWALLCGAGVRQCTLNIIYVLVEVEAPDGTKRGVPLSR